MYFVGTIVSLLFGETYMGNRFSKIFPNALDNAMVLFFTPKGNYGDLFNEDGTVAAHYSYTGY